MTSATLADGVSVSFSLPSGVDLILKLCSITPPLGSELQVQMESPPHSDLIACLSVSLDTRASMDTQIRRSSHPLYTMVSYLQITYAHLAVYL